MLQALLNIVIIQNRLYSLLHSLVLAFDFQIVNLAIALQ